MSPIDVTFILSFLTFFIMVAGAPALDAGSLKQNGISAQQLNAQFASIKKTDACNGSDMACVEGAFAQCIGSKWVLTQCANGTQCYALPLVNKAGTSITCDSEADASSRIASTGAPGGLLGSARQAPSFAADVNGTGCSGDINGSNNGTINGNSTIPPLGATNGTSANAGNTTFGPGSIPGTNGSNSSFPTAATGASTTTPSPLTSSFTFTQTRSATLAPGFTLPTAAATAGSIIPSANASSITASTSTGFSSAPTDVTANISSPSPNPVISPTPTIGFGNTIITLSPASASAFFSSLAAASGTLVGSPSATTAAPKDVGNTNGNGSAPIILSFFSIASAPTGTSPVSLATPSYIRNTNNNNSSPITLSFFSTSLAPTGTPVTLAASASSTSSGVGASGGYGYRRGVRRV